MKPERSSGSPMRWPVQVHVAHWQHVRFVPLIINLRAGALGTEFLRRPVEAMTLEPFKKHQLFQQ